MAVADRQLTFQKCSPSVPSQQWKLVPANASTVYLRGPTGCIVGASSGTLEAKECDATDPLQQFMYNTTTKNALPVGSRGFILSPSSGTECQEGRHSSTVNGCCLTNNSPSLVLWGCCPYSPSPCTNQRIVAHSDGTLRNGELCNAGQPFPTYKAYHTHMQKYHLDSTSEYISGR